MSKQIFAFPETGVTLNAHVFGFKPEGAEQEPTSKTYEIVRSASGALKEFAPDKLIILGPGSTLGGAVAQSLIKQQWLELTCKSDFINLQKSEPFILAMGLPDQRKQVVT